MTVESLSILDYKNIVQAELAFSPGINFFFGNNGMGKTNGLDALYYLCFCKSYSHLPDYQVVRHEREYSVLQGFFSVGEKKELISCTIKRKQKKIFKRNKKEYERLSDHIGLLPVVMISPNDSNIILGGSEERRKFVDMVISQYDKSYLRALIYYNKVLTQRNSMLKDNKTDIDLSLLQILDDQLVENGRILYEKREHFITLIEPVFNHYYQTISQERENVGLIYQSQLKTNDLHYLLSNNREKDQLLGYTNVGPHKDDIDLMLGHHLMRKIGSQGQNKTCLIALKLAQFNVLVDTGVSTPILLLDDLFDKLDSFRVEQIIQLVIQPPFGQLFITDTNRLFMDEMVERTGREATFFQVENGFFHTIHRP